MSYEFEANVVGRLKVENFRRINGNTLTLRGINAQSDANVVIGGVNQLLGIVNLQNEYDPADVTRTVKQNVIEQE